ncbi:aminobenzoyl-glutamate transport protein [Saccharopolyspora antimicrobica]|uniref:Aminobenzoyl-glutamate transport protein n=1 Tax=Saccharopolyspora antimicrobica TaxID=455193 RepID=A0A1I4S4A3_9PSEU|nr:AbgT family transporter [Saccharopolyspora antimicrobica]RKT87574.1 aminobenzoyl-glutamate transport protein [Saccharopolyspora antimicrobica]SFM59114.1 aminobenzoyl-glutamate transport protein [Saccharopolyspora antimicrobica]
MDTARTRQTRLDRVFAGIERVGGKLPEPFFLFVYLLAALAVISTAVAAFGVTVDVPGKAEPVPVRAVLSSEGLVWFLTNFVDNFIGFPPLGTVLAMMLVVGFAERTGFLSAAVTLVFGRAPRWLLPYAVAFVACQAHVMSDPSLIVIPPLAALMFKAAGRHPVAGLIGAFACGATGYGGGILVGSLDGLLVGITEKAVQIAPLGVEVHTHIAMNYFFAATAGLLLPLVGGFLIDRVLEPRLGPWTDPEGEQTADLTARQRKGVRRAFAVLIAYAVVAFGSWLVPGSFLRGEAGELVPSPFLDSIVPLIIVAFLLAGLAYGLTAGTVATRADVPRMMTETVKDMAGYIVFIFVAAQFIALFTWSNLGTLIAIGAADGLRAAHLTGFPAIIVMVLLATVANLFITSGSALWSLLAPVMIPAFTILGYDPAFIQAAYRIGDSTTQAVSPLNAYVYILLSVNRKYQPETQLGTLLARLSVFVLPFFAMWLLILAVFYFFDLPVGPGSGIRL